METDMKRDEIRRTTRWCACLLVVAGGFLTWPLAGRAAPIDDQLGAIRAVGAEGKDHAAAIAAVTELSRGRSDSLIPILKAFDDANHARMYLVSTTLADWLAVPGAGVFRHATPGGGATSGINFYG